MKTVINKFTKEKLYNTVIYDIFLNDDEELVDFIPEKDNIELIQQEKLNIYNKSQFDELSLTDWYFIRNLENGEIIPDSILRERQQIRDKYNKLKEEL